MFIRLVYLVVFCVSYVALHAQVLTATVKGVVYDKESRQPLSNVSAVILSISPPVGTQSAEDGSFKITSVPVGRHTLRFSYLGYEEVTLNEVLLSSGKELFLEISMNERVNSLKEVTVQAQKEKGQSNNDYAAVSVRSFSAEEMTRYAGTLNDPARMAQSFAGVMTANDENNQIVVRGNSPRGLLWRMEGIEIPNPNHFAGSEGSTGGGVSILSANMLTNTDFMSGAFPAEYGNALSGVFDLNLRKGNTEKHEVALQAGVLGLEAAAEGPFSKKYQGSYLINYRYSTLDILSLMGIQIGGNVLPKYQDLAFNINLPTKKLGRFTVFGIGGLSGLGEEAKKDTASWKSFADKTEYTQAQQVGAAGLTHIYLLKDNKTYLKTIVSYSYTNNSSRTDSLGNDFTPFALSDERYAYRALRTHLLANSKLDAKNSVRTGLMYSLLHYRLFNEQFVAWQNTVRQIADNRGQYSLLQAYAQWKHRFSEWVSLNSGLHLTYSSINEKVYLEPRLGVEWKLPYGQALTAGAGLHSRVDAVSTYVAYSRQVKGETVRPNTKLDFTRSAHLVLGYQWPFKKDFRLKTEVYMQYLFAVPVGFRTGEQTFSILNQDDGFSNMPLQGNGRGINYGLELTLEKFFSKNYFFTFTASLFDSRYRAADGQWRNTAYNVNYVLNALGGKEFVIGKKRNNIIGIIAKVIWRGGQRYTPVDLEASALQQQTVTNEAAAFSAQLPDYVRMDFGVNYRRNKKKYSWVLSFDAQNIINRQNVARFVYDPELQQIRTVRNLGIVPVVSWKIYFGFGGRMAGR